MRFEDGLPPPMLLQFSETMMPTCLSVATSMSRGRCVSPDIKASSTGIFLGRIRDALYLSVLFLKLSLHFKVRLTLSLDPLLLNISNHSSMHGLDTMSLFSHVL